VRDWDLRRIDICVASYLRLRPEVISELIVVDFGSSDPVALDCADPRLKVVRVEASDWSLSEAINVGVLSSSNDVIFKTDADILLSSRDMPGVVAAFGSIASGEVDLALFRVRDLLMQCDLEQAATAVQEGIALEGALRPIWGQGCIAFTKAIWSRVGGYDSRLTGWGLEDNDFCDRCRRAGGRQRWVPVIDACLVHVWHPPAAFHPSVARQRNRSQDRVRRDRSIQRPMQVRHSAGLAAPAIAAIPPHVSIAIATCDRPGRDRMMLECIESFIGQIGNDFEVDILDNGSSEEASRRLQQQLLRLPSGIKVRFWREDYRSIARARNQLAHEARGRFTAIMDDDDLSMPKRLEDHLRNFDEAPSIHGSHGGWIDFDEATGLTEYTPGKARTIETLLAGTGKITAHSTCMYRTDVMRKVPYDELLDLGSDWDLALRMTLLGLRVAHTGSYVLLRRFHENNVTLTASSTQFAAGRASRSRVITTLSEPARQRLAIDAKALDAEIACLNAPEAPELLAMLPANTGQWHLAFAATEIQSSLADGEAINRTLSEMEARAECLQSGLSAPVYFVTPAISGAASALRKAAEVERTLGFEAAFIAARQLALNSEVAFDWRSLGVGSGEVVLLSKAYRELDMLLVDMGAVPQGSLLRAGLRLVADSDEMGRCYYIIGPKGPPSDEISAFRRQLMKHGLETTPCRSTGPSRRFTSANFEAVR
jgi:glycosyltransferase involved in cell wall biosynthesis